jgi:gliding motility-associated protein GldM
MSLPKEPRQKMINMMYLVLTALLALNVSTEVLEAFKTVDKSIQTSNKAIDGKNAVIFAAFKDEASNPQTAAKAAVWSPKADKIHQLALGMSTYLNDLKLTLKTRSGLKVEDGKEDFKEDDLDGPTKLFTEEDEGVKLYDKMIGFKKQVLDVLKPEEFADNPVLAADIKKAKADFDKSLPVNLVVDPERIKGNSTGDDKKDWAFVNFHMTPTIAAITILSKLENDVKNTESQMVDYCHSQIGKVKVVFDKFQAIAQSNTSYAMPGDAIEITSGVGAFSEAAKPKIYVEGQLQPLNPDGTAVYKTTASGSGDHNVNVKIEYAKPDGSIETVNKVVKYTVGVPSGASVFLEKMNVLYVGVDNPLTISAGSAGAEKMHPTFSNGSITHTSGDKYVIKPTTLGPATINVLVNGKNTPFSMRCKRLPDPVPTVGGSKGGRIASATFKAQGGVIAKLLESEFDAPFQVISYTVGANGGTIGIYRTAGNEGARWGGNAANIINSCGPGTSVFFDDVRAKGPDGVVRNLGTLAFQLQ